MNKPSNNPHAAVAINPHPSHSLGMGVEFVVPVGIEVKAAATVETDCQECAGSPEGCEACSFTGVIEKPW